MDFEKLYRETFSQVRASSPVNLEEFHHMKHKTTVKYTLLAAVIALLLALGAAAYATDFFGLRAVILSDEAGNPGLISMQGYADSPEYLALYDYYYGGLTLEQAAEKHGLTVPDRCEVFGYDTLAELLGGDLTDEHNTRYSFYIYEDGTFGGDQEFTAADGTLVSYQMYRSVKGSLTQVALNSAALEEDYEEWNIKIDGYDVCLVLGGGDRSLIISDLGDCFLTINVLAGKVLDPTFGGPIDRAQLEALARSLHLDVLSRVAVPDLPPAPPKIDYGAGVALQPEYIDEAQSFDVELPHWGKTRFISYLPTPEFEDVRFFLSRDGKVSDYEFHTMYNEIESAEIVAVCFEDLTGDGLTDVLVLIDYRKDGAPDFYRDIRLFRYVEHGEFTPVWGLQGTIYAASPADAPDVDQVRTQCRIFFADGGDNDPAMQEDVVVTAFNLVEGDRDIGVEVIGRKGPFGDRWGVRELRIYDCDKSGRWADAPFQTIAVTGAGDDYVSGVYAGYTECWSREDTVRALDMNFDGYTDLGVFGWTPNNTIPYYYWFWNEGFGGFEYTITLQGAEPNPETRQVVESYKLYDGYIVNYYEPDAAGYLQLVERKTEQFGDYVEANDYEGMLGYLQSQYDDPFYLRYGLFDLTGDGTVELIAGYGTCEADATCGVWSMDSGRLRKIGAFGMGHAQLYVVEGKLIRLEGHMGYEFISEIGFDGTQVTETLLSQRQLGPADEYADFDTPFEMRPDDDLGLLR